MNESKCVGPYFQKGDNTFIFFSLSNLQILKKTHHPITDVMTSLCHASVPCAIPAIVIQTHEQSMYSFTL